MLSEGIRLAFPAALLLPAALGILLLWLKPKSRAIPCASAPSLAGVPASLRARLRTPVLGLLTISALLLAGFAAARPQRVQLLEKDDKARNIMLAIDLSQSMAANDFGGSFGRMNRLEAVKSVVRDFVAERRGDRIGLVVFGNRAFLQAPLTKDLGLVEQVVKSLEVGIAGDGTAIGDGLGLSLKRIQDLPGRSKAIILLTDGVSNAGSVNPLKAAAVAKDLGIKVHTVGVGTNAGSLSVGGGFFGLPVQSQAEFDEKTLKDVAALTGGVYFNASTLQGLQEVYKSIDSLERTVGDDAPQEETEELFPPLLVAAIVCYLSLLLLSRTVFLKLP